MRLVEAPIAFVLGGIIYVLLELLWRGRSDISMALAGGMSFLLMHMLFTKYAPPLWLKCLTGMLLITAIEFVTGYIVNIRMGRAVWDYSGEKLNLYGQICLRFSLIWAALSIPASWLSRALHSIAERLTAG